MKLSAFRGEADVGDVPLFVTAVAATAAAAFLSLPLATMDADWVGDAATVNADSELPSDE